MHCTDHWCTALTSDGLHWPLMRWTDHWCIAPSSDAFYWLLIYFTGQWCTALATDALHWSLMHCTDHWCTALTTDALHWSLMHCTGHWCTVLSTGYFHLLGGRVLKDKVFPFLLIIWSNKLIDKNSCFQCLPAYFSHDWRQSPKKNVGFVLKARNQTKNLPQGLKRLAFKPKFDFPIEMGIPHGFHETFGTTIQAGSHTHPEHTHLPC